MYAYYKNYDLESAVDQADQFIRENPTHPRVDYAYYIRGLVYFESGANWLERVFRADVTQRPPGEARKSLQAFQLLVERYPKSPYAADSRQRMVYLRNRLADYELAVARYYVKRGAYVGAVNRAREVIQTYDGSPAALEALQIMANGYDQLGVPDLAVLARGVYAKNDALPAIAPRANAGLAMTPSGPQEQTGAIRTRPRGPGAGRLASASSSRTRARPTSRAARRSTSPAARVSLPAWTTTSTSICPPARA